MVYRMLVIIFTIIECVLQLSYPKMGVGKGMAKYTGRGVSLDNTLEQLVVYVTMCTVKTVFKAFD